MKTKDNTMTWILSLSFLWVSTLRVGRASPFYPLRHSNRQQVQQQQLQQQQQRGAQETTNNSDDPHGERRFIPAFSVLLSSSPIRLNNRDEINLANICRDVLKAYMEQQLTNNSMDYVLLGAMDAQQTGDNVSLSFQQGVVSFVVGADTVPTAQTIHLWVQQAMEQDLIPALQLTDYYFFQTAQFVVSSSDSGTNNNNTGSDPDEDEEPPPPPPSNIVSGNNNNSTQQPAASQTNTGIIVGTVIGAVVLLVLVVLFVGRNRQRQRHGHANNRTRWYLPDIDTKEIDNDDDDKDTVNLSLEAPNTPPRRSSSSTPPTSPSTTNTSNKTSPQSHVPVGAAAYSPHDHNATDTKSVGGESASEFTVHTEAGDSAALQSLSQPYVVSPKQQQLVESFERPVSLRKDMLTSAWSTSGGGGGGGGRGGVGGGGAAAATASSPWRASAPHHHHHNSESVLEPSHFLAAEERERTTSTAPMLFCQANEEPTNVVHMTPPSQTTRQRSMD